MNEPTDPVSLAWFAEVVLGTPMDAETLGIASELQQQLVLITGDLLTTKLLSSGVLSMKLGKNVMLRVPSPNQSQAKRLIETIFEVVADGLNNVKS